MKKTFKIYLLFIIVLLVSLTFVNAANINMNLDNNNVQSTEENVINNSLNENEGIENNNISNNVATNTSNNTIDNTVNTQSEQNNSTPRMTSSTTTKEETEFLTPENILSVIIIVIGVLLIFLSIAILIRNK